MGEGGKESATEKASCAPATPYGKSKLTAQRFVISGNYIPEPVVLRLSMVYGRTHKGNLPRMLKGISKGTFPPLSELSNSRSMVHVDDVVQALILASSKPAAVGQPYIVTDGQAVSTSQLYDWMCEALNKPRPSWSIPISVLKAIALTGDVILGTRPSPCIRL